MLRLQEILSVQKMCLLAGVNGVEAQDQDVPPMSLLPLSQVLFRKDNLVPRELALYVLFLQFYAISGRYAAEGVKETWN